MSESIVSDKWNRYLQANYGTPENLSDADKAKYANTHLYEITFLNKGGLVMPVIVEFTFEDEKYATWFRIMFPE